MEEKKRGPGRPRRRQRNFRGKSFHVIRQGMRLAEEDLLKLVKLEEYLTAFDKALTMSNLNVLLFLCKQMEPKAAFSNGHTDSKFPQTTILSLIQQLSVDLKYDTETKVAYLHESIAMLNCEEEVTREQMPVVLQFLTGELYHTIDDIQRTDPRDEQLESLKMLLRTTRTILSRCRGT